MSYTMFIPFLMAGCAFSYVDEQGTQHIIGLSHVALTGVENNSLTAGDEVEVENLGLLFLSGPLHKGVGLGYTQQSTMFIKNNALVIPQAPTQNTPAEQEIQE